MSKKPLTRDGIYGIISIDKMPYQERLQASGDKFHLIFAVQGDWSLRSPATTDFRFLYIESRNGATSCGKKPRDEE